MKNQKDPIDTFTEVFVIACIIVLFYLKIVNVIKISWFWFLSPLWLLLAIGCVLAIIFIIYLVIILIKTAIDMKRSNKKNEWY